MKHRSSLDQGRSFLRNRRLRRKLMGVILGMLLLAISLGTWVLDSWISASVLRFGVFWGIVTLYTLLLLMLCFYDMLRVRRGG